MAALKRSGLLKCNTGRSTYRLSAQSLPEMTEARTPPSLSLARVVTSRSVNAAWQKASVRTWFARRSPSLRSHVPSLYLATSLLHCASLWSFRPHSTVELLAFTPQRLSRTSWLLISTGHVGRRLYCCRSSYSKSIPDDSARFL